MGCAPDLQGAAKARSLLCHPKAMPVNPGECLVDTCNILQPFCMVDMFDLNLSKQPIDGNKVGGHCYHLSFPIVAK